MKLIPLSAKPVKKKIQQDLKQSNAVLDGNLFFLFCFMSNFDEGYSLLFAPQVCFHVLLFLRGSLRGCLNHRVLVRHDLFAKFVSVSTYCIAELSALFHLIQTFCGILSIFLHTNLKMHKTMVVVKADVELA